MRVVDYINQADPKKVAELYRKHYYSGKHRDGWGNVEAFKKFRGKLNDSIGVNREMSVVLREVKDFFDPEYYIDVSGIDPSGEIWAIEFNPWGEWKLMEVHVPREKNLSVDEIAMHIYYEMTWGGWEEQSQERLAELIDQVEEVKRSLDRE